MGVGLNLVAVLVLGDPFPGGVANLDSFQGSYLLYIYFISASMPSFIEAV